MPFIPLPGEYWRAWNGLLTGLLCGNRALFLPEFERWTALAEMFRFQMPLYDTRNPIRTLTHYFGRYRGNAPLLAVAATDVRSGEAVLFDSISERVTPRMLAASIAIPIQLSPIEIDRRHLWGGEVRCETLLSHVLSLLAKLHRSSNVPDDYLVIVVDTLNPSTGALPTSTWESHYRVLNIAPGNKLKSDRKQVEIGNAFLNAMKRLGGLIHDEVPAPMADAIEDEYQKALLRQQARIELLHIGRGPFPYEPISRDFDYSPQYLARLIRQGFKNGLSALQAHERRHSSESLQRYPRLVHLSNF